MTKDPAFLFYSNDFMSLISDLDMKERGQIITMFCLQHQKGHLSKRIIKLNIGKVSKNVLNKFETDEEDNYYNKWLEELIIKRKQHSEKQKNNIKKRYENATKKLPNDYQNSTKTTTKKLPLENENENEIENINKLYVSSSLKEENIETFIENNFSRTLSSIEYEKIIVWQEMYDMSLIIYAIKEAVYNRKMTFSYVEGILKNLHGCGYKTYSDIPKRKTQNNEQQRNKTKEEIFEYDWLNESSDEE